MNDTDLPELPPIPYLPPSKSAEEAILGEWARAYGKLCAEMQREKDALLCVDVVWRHEAELKLERSEGASECATAIRNQGINLPTPAK